MDYDKHVRYLDYCKSGERIKGGGFARTERNGDFFKLDLTLKGILSAEGRTAEVILTDLEGETVLGRIRVENGGGSFRYQGNLKRDLPGRELSAGELTGLRIPLGGEIEVSCKWPAEGREKESSRGKEPESKDGKRPLEEPRHEGGKRPLEEPKRVDGKRPLEGSKREDGKHQPGGKEREDGKHSQQGKDGGGLRKEDDKEAVRNQGLFSRWATAGEKEERQGKEEEKTASKRNIAPERESMPGGETTSERESMSEGETTSEGESMSKGSAAPEGEVISEGRIVPEEKNVSNTRTASEQTQTADVTGEAHKSRAVRLREDKWRQLWAIYPHIQPFQDERDYLSLSPADFVLFSEESYRTANNSFLLHGYYNYRHLILTKLEKRGEILYYLGVPGNYFDREKQVAVMFGFESFECAEEPAQEGDFGYYMMKVTL
ncbi:MAG: hypothetical protein NC432_00900 [Roseburia sp.]|nr:hypothetical protein [Roseburia sp.]MCM1098282.1 hypothetical protein [Ruminococcus flavefaciens]